MKLLVAGIVTGLVLGVMLAVIYFSLGTFFGAESRRTAKQKSPEDSIRHGEGYSAVPQKMKARAGK
jgi:branched-subunit amino acid permease